MSGNMGPSAEMDGFFDSILSVITAPVRLITHIVPKSLIRLANHTASVGLHTAGIAKGQDVDLENAKIPDVFTAIGKITQSAVQSAAAVVIGKQAASQLTFNNLQRVTNPFALQIAVMKVTPGVKQVYGALDSVSGGTLSSTEELVNLPGKAFRGEKISRAELIRNAVFAAKLGAIAVSGGSAASVIGFASSQLKAGPLGKSSAGNKLLSIGEVAGLAAAGTGSVVEVLQTKAEDKALGAATDYAATKSGLDQTALGRTSLAVGSAEINEGDEGVEALATAQVENTALAKTGLDQNPLLVGAVRGQDLSALGTQVVLDKTGLAKNALISTAANAAAASPNTPVYSAAAVTANSVILPRTPTPAPIAAYTTVPNYAQDVGIRIANNTGRPVTTTVTVRALPQIDAQALADQVLAQESQKIAAANQTAVDKANAAEAMRDKLKQVGIDGVNARSLEDLKLDPAYIAANGVTGLNPADRLKFDANLDDLLQKANFDSVSADEAAAMAMEAADLLFHQSVIKHALAGDGVTIAYVPGKTPAEAAQIAARAKAAADAALAAAEKAAADAATAAMNALATPIRIMKNAGPVPMILLVTAIGAGALYATLKKPKALRI